MATNGKICNQGVFGKETASQGYSKSSSDLIEAQTRQTLENLDGCAGEYGNQPFGTALTHTTQVAAPSAIGNEAAAKAGAGCSGALFHLRPNEQRKSRPQGPAI
jgi:hypothetical protein